MPHDPYNQQPYDPNQGQPQPSQQPQPQQQVYKDAYSGYDEQNTGYVAPTYPSQASRIQVESVVFVPTGTYQQQWRRPWTAEVNQGNLSAVYDAVGMAYRDHQHKRNTGTLPQDAKYMIDPTILAGVSSSFIHVAEAGEAPARLNILHSLEYQVARFVMTVLVYRRQGVEPTRYKIIGYTDHLGISRAGDRAGLNNSDYYIEPNMQLTINTIVEVRNRTADYGYGMQTTEELITVNQLLVDNNYTGVDQAKVIRMRPYEVAATLARMQEPSLNQVGVTSTDTRIIQTSQPALSNYHHTNPNDYMANVISGLVNGKDLAALTNKGGVLAPYNQAAEELRDPSALKDPFLSALANYTDGTARGSFLWRDLLNIDPNAGHDQICRVNWRDYADPTFTGVMGQNMARGYDTSLWNGKDLETQIAAQIVNVLPALMLDLGIRSIQVLASNLSREMVCHATHGWPVITGQNIVPQQIALSRLFQQQVVVPMTYNGGIAYDMVISADLQGEIVIKLSLEGRRAETYVQPAFMSAAMSPVLTSRPDTLENLATEFQNLQRNIQPARSPLMTDAVYGASPSQRY